MATVLDEITSALKELGVLASGETPAADDALDALAALNRLLDQWAAERLQIYTVTRTVFTLVNGTQDYTVGTGGTVNVARPVFVENVTFQNTAVSPVIEYPLDELTESAYQGLVLKTISTPFPSVWYYNPTFPLGTLTFWPVPTSTTLQGVLYAPQAVASFAALTTTVSLPPAYERMLVKNLALELLPSYQVQLNPLLLQQAQEAKATVKRANTAPRDMSFEASVANTGGGWNIRTGP